MEGIFSKTPSPLWKFQLNFTHFFYICRSYGTPDPQEIPIPSVGGVWKFSGNAQCKNLQSGKLSFTFGTAHQTVILFCSINFFFLGNTLVNKKSI